MKRLVSLCPSDPRSPGRYRVGMTLIEVLIATALTLVIMLALAQGFKTLSQGVSAGRARLTGSDQLRGMSSLLRADLSGMTANIRQLPQTQQAANGYLEYYDGPLSDSTAMLYNYNPLASTPEEKLSASRWSDIDDILMFTAKAKDGQWFRGRVPLALLKIHQRNRELSLTGNSTIQPTVQDWLTDVSVASEYAEIAWFMRPLNAVGGLTVTGTLLGDTPVLDVAPGVIDRDANGVPEPDGMPDRVALCRRVLLIRPDLNITPDPSLTLPGNAQLACLPAPFNDQNSARAHMRFPYQRCDLSVRSQFDASRTGFVLRTNSLADLQSPENRFAHYVAPFVHPLFGDCASLPLLALTLETDFSKIDSHYGRMIANALGFNFAGASMTPVDHGFIPDQFFRTKIDADSNGNVVSVRPTLEEILASNVVGFDVRGYDGMVQQLASPGADGNWGVTNNVTDAGAPGTDDLVVGPSDPGYAVQIANNAIVPIGTGAFVDLCWGRRVLYQMNRFSPNAPSDLSPPDAFVFGAYGGYSNGPSDYKASPPLPHRTLWSTPLSGFDSLVGGVLFRELTSLNLSGRYNPSIFAYQPTFDTFTDAYESDGNRQRAGFSANGLVRYGLGYSSNNPQPDGGIDGLDLNDSDGIDNDGDGTVDEANETNGAVDEELELETRPPIVYPMPAIQVKFRIQDISAGTLQELSIVHDLTGK